MDFISIVIAIVALVANWFVYKKMGRQGWEGIIPIYNTYVLFQELYGDGWRFLLLLVPLYNIYLACKVQIDLAHRFNQSTGFGWGLILLPTIFDCILGFDNKIQWGDGSNTVNVEFNASAFQNKSKKADEDAAALLKFKELLDSGAITQEEYDQKKKEILGL